MVKVLTWLVRDWGSSSTWFQFSSVKIVQMRGEIYIIIMVCLVLNGCLVSYVHGYDISSL